MTNYCAEGEIQIGGQTLALKLGLKQLQSAERQMRERIGVTLADGPRKWGHEGTVILLWACLSDSHSSLTVDEVRDRYFLPKYHGDLLLKIFSLLADLNGVSQEELNQSIEDALVKAGELENAKNSH